MNFVQDLLTRHHRREAVQSTIKSKLRGRRLLLESTVTVAPHEARRAREITATNQSTAGRRIASQGITRKVRRKVLIRLGVSGAKIILYGLSIRASGCMC